MKKLTMIGMAALLMLAVSCKKDNEQKINNAGNGFRATVETQASNSKTHLEGYDLKWDGDEEILVSSSTSGAKKFSVNKLEGGTAIFEAAETLPEDFYTPDYTAYYPASVLSGDFSFLAEQDYATNSFAAEANPMVAVSGNETLFFKNICGVLELNFTGDFTVKTITITSNDVLSGTGTLDLTDPENPALTLTGDGHSITLDCGEGVALNPTTATAFRIVAPAGAFANGFKVELTDAAGKVWTKTTTKNNNIVRSTVTLLDAIEVDIPTPYYSVSATKKVLFAHGNLQYIGSAATPYWQFAEEQYQVLATDEDDPQIGGTQTIDRDYFGWGANGIEYSGHNTKFHPYDYDINGDENKGYGYGPTYNNYQSDLSGNSDWDWGALFNDKEWRTLSHEEWSYLFHNDGNRANLKGLGRANGINGIFILPDNWDEMVAFVGIAAIADNFEYGYMNDFSKNNYSHDEWKKMEEAGATFLPAAGYRWKGNKKAGLIIDGIGACCEYWTSTHEGKGRAWAVDIDLEHFDNTLMADHKRSKGFCVRLAYDLPN